MHATCSAVTQTTGSPQSKSGIHCSFLRSFVRPNITFSRFRELCYKDITPSSLEMVQLSCLSVLVVGMFIAQVASVAERPSHHGKGSHAMIKRWPNKSGTTATINRFNVRSDESWWCGLGPAGSPEERHADSIYPVNHLFSPEDVTKTMEMAVGQGRGSFRKYPGNFANKNVAGGDVFASLVVTPGYKLKYFPILSNGLKWQPAKGENQDAGNFRMVYSASSDNKTLVFHGLLFHPPKSRELRHCVKLTPEEAKAAKIKQDPSKDSGPATPPKR